MKYLIRTRKGKVLHTKHIRAHYWLEETNDTICRMYSTGGMHQTRYEVYNDPQGKEICQMENQQVEEIFRQTVG